MLLVSINVSDVSVNVIINVVDYLEVINQAWLITLLELYRPGVKFGLSIKVYQRPPSAWDAMLG